MKCKQSIHRNNNNEFLRYGKSMEYGKLQPSLSLYRGLRPLRVMRDVGSRSRIINRKEQNMKTAKITIIVLALAGLIGTAQATIVAEYLFDQSLNNTTAGGGYAMSAVNGSGTYNRYTVWGEEKYALDLNGTQGLNVDASGIADTNTFTIIMDVRTSEVSAYNKLLSLDGGGNASDNGLYLYDYDTVLYNNQGIASDFDNVSADTWTRIALVSSATELRLYVGTEGSLTDVGSTTGELSRSNTFLFFKDDDVSIARENYDLTVSAVWISDAVMSQTEIEAIPGTGLLLSPHFSDVTCVQSNVSLQLANLLIGSTTTVQRAENLLSPSWTNVAQFISSSSSTNLSDTADMDRAFYRFLQE